MSRGPLMMAKTFAERMGIRSIDAPDGTRLEVESFEIETKSGDRVRVVVRYGMLFGPAPAPEADSTGGYAVPVELEEATRSELVIAQRGVAIPLGPELSDWIDGSIEPQIVGVYERNFPPTSRILPAYSLWDGASWHSMHPTVRKAHFERALSSCQNAPWRGLRHDPSRREGHAS